MNDSAVNLLFWFGGLVTGMAITAHVYANCLKRIKASQDSLRRVIEGK